jgi:hypothetical protein
MKLGYLCSVGVAALALASPVNAGQITGSIGFSGIGSTWSFDGTNGFKLSPTAPAINIQVDTVSAGSTFVAEGVAVGDTGTMYDVNVTTLPVAPQWTLGIFSFDLQSASIDFIDNTLPVLALFMSGKGTLKAAGYDDTPGTWTWTGTSTDGVSFTFAPTTAATPVPEPGSLTLLALGLFGVAGAVRRVRR